MAEYNPEVQYQLRCSLIGHTMDVRAVAVAPNGDIVTTSRDQTAKLWKESEGNSRIYEEKVTYKGHTGYVTSVCLVPGDSDSSSYTVTGSKDTLILVFLRDSPTPLHSLTGHTDTVSCLSWSNKKLVSGSWDHSIKVWINWECIATLKGHEGPVWSVAVQEDEEASKYLLLSASADKTLKCWDGDKDIVTYNGHTDCVRGIALLSKERFISCSNDATIRIWTMKGDLMACFYAHSSFIYSIYYINESIGVVTGSEDRSAQVFTLAGHNHHRIMLPAQSVWSVAALPNNDIVVGTSDGICRVFTQSVDRFADAEEMDQFEEGLSKFKIALKNIGGIKKKDLPDKTYLFKPGKRDGQNVMIRDEGKILCYSWSSPSGKWIAMGEVIGGEGGSADTSGKVLHQGREYDYVFDVDLDEGRSLKLPYNIGEDPWIAAQAFIHRHELPQDYLDQVASFITKNANIPENAFRANSSYCDPFTGASRYVPGGSSAAQQPMSQRNLDPFTSGGSYVAAGSSAPETTSSQYFPQTIPLKFEAVNKDGILSKLLELNASVPDPLTDEEAKRLVEAVVKTPVDVSDLGPLEKALQWPSQNVWPALDILRLALRSGPAQEHWLGEGKGESVIALLVTFLASSIAVPTRLLTMRCLANMFSHEVGKKALANACNPVITSIVALAPYPNKNLEIAAATVILNYCILFKTNDDFETQCQLLSGSATLALSVDDPEAQFRNLVAIGTLLFYGGKNMKSLANSLDLRPVVERSALKEEPNKVVECASHILRLL